MLDSCRFLVELTRGESVDRYVGDRLFRGAVQRELQIIGEALLQLRALDQATAAKIREHERIIGFRHVLVHGYDVVDSSVVWHIVQERLPELLRDLEGLIEE